MGLPANMNVHVEDVETVEPIEERKESQVSQDSHTASDYIQKQLELEADAREVLPYKFDSCSRELGPLRQSLFACLTCSPPPASPAQQYTSAGICYSCSISCHGEHTLVELFARRNFVCDCGTTRVLETSHCTLRSDPTTGQKGVHSQEPAKENQYNHNFQNKFCGCGEEYHAYQENGTMYQCLGLGSVESGGCGEDWWHPECLLGLRRDWKKQVTVTETAKIEPSATDEESAEPEDQPVPPGFPNEDDFDGLICYKCVEANPWIKRYAGAEGFLPPVFYQPASRQATSTTAKQSSEPSTSTSLKRKASEDPEDSQTDSTKLAKSQSDSRTEPIRTSQSTPSEPLPTEPQPTESQLIEPHPGETQPTEPQPPQQKHDLLPAAIPTHLGPFTLFLTPTFRDTLCHCPSCFPHLLPHPQLLDEESVYAPSLSRSSSPHHPTASSRGGGSGTNSLYSRGEAALNTVDRVRAIEGVMAYNHLRDKVKEFLRPYAESGRAVGAEDVKAYFAKLRGDDEGEAAEENRVEDEDRG